MISRLIIAMTSAYMGSDGFGNRYYEGRRKNRLGQRRRFVVYSGQAEASKVPAEWHGWLHYTDDDIPPEEGYPRQHWQKDHVPNLTGTIYAHHPSDQLGQGEQKTGDYAPWKPE